MLLTANQKWYDPALEKYGISYAKVMTRFLYQNIVPAAKIDPDPNAPDCSEEWSKWGIITQFDRVLTFAGVGGLAVGMTPTEVQILDLQTNNLNWMLVSRVAASVTLGPIADANIAPINVGCNADPGFQLMDVQPASLVFGNGQWPHIMLMPEEWPTNIFRRWTVTNNAAVNRIVYLGFKFLQVRTA
jgi:hypothetical protein